MAQGTVLAEIALSGDKTFRRAVESMGDQMDDASSDAVTLGGTAHAAASALDDLATDGISAAASMVGLSSTTDEAGDELTEASIRAMGTSSAFTTLSLSSDGAALSVGALGGSLMLSLLPALVAVGSMIAPIVAALTVLTGGAIAFGGAMAAVPLLGMAGHMKELKKAFQGTVGSIMSVTEPMRELFFPILLQILDELPTLVSSIMASVGGFDEFGAMFIGLWEIAKDVLPGLIGYMADLARDAWPVLIDLITWTRQNAPAMFDAMMASTRRLAPVFMNLLGSFQEFLPALLDFGIIAVETLLPALTRAIVLGGDLLTQITNLGGGMDQLVVAGMALAPVLLTIGSALAGLSLPILGLIAAVGALAVAYQQDIGRIREVVNRFAGEFERLMGDRIPKLLSAAADAWKVWKPVVMPILEGLVDILGTGLLVTLDLVLSSLTGIMQLLSGDFSGAFETFMGLMERFRDRIARLFNRLTGGVFEDLVNGLINAVNKTGNILEGFVSQVPFLDQSFEFTELGSFEQQIGGPRGRVGDTNRGRRARAPVREQAVAVDVQVSGELVEKDGQIKAVIDERSMQMIKNQAQQSQLQ